MRSAALIPRVTENSTVHITFYVNEENEEASSKRYDLEKNK